MNEEKKEYPLYAIVLEIREILDLIEQKDGECDDETYNKLVQWQGTLAEKSEKICHLKAKLENEILYYKKIEESARIRRTNLEKTIERLRNYLAQSMSIANVKQIKKEGGLFTISLHEGKEKVVIENAEALPFDCIEIVEQIKPKTDIIKSRLKKGENIPGAKLIIGDPYVIIRTPAEKNGGKENE